MDREPFDALDRGILGLIAVYDEVARDDPPAADLAAIPDRLPTNSDAGGS